MLVHTTKGLIDHSELDVKDLVTWEGTARVTATEWRYHDELVRRDVFVNILRGQEVFAEQGSPG